jgi:hypothetical protein
MQEQKQLGVPKQEQQQQQEEQEEPQPTPMLVDPKPEGSMQVSNALVNCHTVIFCVITGSGISLAAHALLTVTLCILVHNILPESLCADCTCSLPSWFCLQCSSSLLTSCFGVSLLHSCLQASKLPSQVAAWSAADHKKLREAVQVHGIQLFAKIAGGRLLAGKAQVFYTKCRRTTSSQLCSDYDQLLKFFCGCGTTTQQLRK